MPPTSSHWVHDLSPFLIQFTETLGIRYYGLAYVLGFVGAAWLLARYARAGRSHLPAAKIGDLMFALILGVFLGGRLGYFILYQPETVLADPLQLLRVWEGGMASHGGFIGVILALAWFGRANQLPFLHLGDLVASVAPLGFLLGRLANFINGELWGRVSDVSWAVIFPLSAAPGTPVELIPARHPSQLYQAALEGGLLFAYLQIRLWRSDHLRRLPGRIAGEFLLGYALLRSIGEHFREPDAGLLFGLSRGTFYSLFLIIAGVIVIAWSGKATRPVQARE
ncbi:MAG TPA: prolipoprotein diacylglyceryl transferase [Opitutaceae bacterium]